MIKVKYCVQCVWSHVDPTSTWNLRCMHPIVNAKDSWSLSSLNIHGSSCQNERERTWLDFPACGKVGKLWEIRLDSDPKL
jgi:hypothetical protein